VCFTQAVFYFGEIVGSTWQRFFLLVLHDGDVITRVAGVRWLGCGDEYLHPAAICSLSTSCPSSLTAVLCPTECANDGAVPTAAVDRVVAAT
jgi:hypothetical protein